MLGAKASEYFVLVLDPVYFALRWGMLHRLRGTEASRRAAVSELLELGRDFAV